MRTLCDVCESAAAILFCAADEASLCRACDDKVAMCVYFRLALVCEWIYLRFFFF